MKKIGIFLFVITLVLGVVVSNMYSYGRPSHGLFDFHVNFGGEKGSGRSVTEKREVNGFRGVDAGGVFQVEIVSGKEYTVEVQADDNLMKHIRTEVRDGVLNVESDGRISPSSPMKVMISAPDIEQLNASGATSVRLTGVKSRKLSLDSSGASKVTVAGEADEMVIDVSGAAKIDAFELSAKSVNVDASGASRVDVKATGEIIAEASGGSRVAYIGEPASVVKNVSGAGSVSAR